MKTPKKARPPKRGVRMIHGNGWRLIKLSVRGDRRDSIFVGTLLGTHNLGGRRVAIFSVRK
jgi:hypothetical protein